MTKTERMKLAIQQRQVAAKIETIVPLPEPVVRVPETKAQNRETKQPKLAKKPKPDGYDRQPEKFDMALQLHDRARLPDGAAFNMVWKAGDWYGMLTLADGQSFKLTGRKLFRLLADIDGLYREWKRQNAEAKS